MEQAECSSEQPQCSRVQTECREQMETSWLYNHAAEQNECVEQAACSSEQMERPSDTKTEHIEVKTCSELLVPLIEQQDTEGSVLIENCSKQVESFSQRLTSSEPMAGSSEQSKPAELTSGSSEQVKSSFDHSGFTSEQPPEANPTTCTFEQVALTSTLTINSETKSESSGSVVCSSMPSKADSPKPVVCASMPSKAGSSEHVPQVSELTVYSESTSCSSQPMECSTAQTAPVEPAKDAEAATDMWSDPWLEKLAEHLEKVPLLWKPSQHMGGGGSNSCKPKSARGFAYSRLLAAIDPAATGSPQEKLQQTMTMCRDFFKRLKYKMKQAAVHCLDSSPDEALRRCPPWVRRADVYLKQMPFVFAQLNATHNRRKKRRSRPRPPPPPPPPTPPLAPAELAAVSAEGARLLRRVVRGLRRAAREHHEISLATVAVVARRVGDTDKRVYELWLGMSKLAAYKLRSLLARGDTPTDAGRLDALDWAIADLLILYEMTLVKEESYKNYEQLSALLATFHLVQQFHLERPGQKVPPREWSEAAHWYSRNRAQMSAVALHRRWVELKTDTRRRFLRRLEAGPQADAPLPLHQAIARRYEHVVVAKKIPKTWRWLVMNGKVAPPTSERGPAPGESEFPKTKDDDDTSDDDAAAAEDNNTNDDDVTIVENTPETIDLSEDKSEDESSAVNEVALPGPSNDKSKDSSPKSTVIKNVTQIVVVSYRTVDKSIDTSKEIVDLDAPSPESNVLEALQELDFSNVQTTIVFDSDEGDIQCVEDTVPDKSEGTTKEFTASEKVSAGHKNKESQSINNRRESSDSDDGNLVIDCDDNEKDSNSNNAGDANTRRRVWKSIEREMLPEPISEWEAVKGNTGTQTEEHVESNNKTQGSSKKDAAKPVDQNNYPLLTGLLKNRSLFDDLLVPDPVKNKQLDSNTKRRHTVKKRMQNRKQKVITVGRKDLDPKHGYVGDEKISHLVSVAKLAEYRKNIVTEIGSQRAVEDSGSESGGGSDSQEESPIDPKLLMYAVVLLRRIDESPQISRQYSQSPLLRLQFKESPHTTPPSTPPCSPPPLTPLSPPNTIIPRTHSHSLFHYFAATLSPSFVFNKHNIPLIKKCKACSVVLRRLDMSERKMACRVAKRVELPDIEEVRRNNRSMLTAQVAPLTQRQDSVSSPEAPSCNSDSDWTPDGAEPYETPLVRVTENTESNAPTETTRTGASAESDEDTDSPGRHVAPTSAELGRLLDDLIAGGSDGECDHGSSEIRGPKALNADSCRSCAVRLLAAPPASGHEERLQRRLLRRLASPAQPTTANTILSTATVTTSTPSTAIPKTTDQKDKSKSSKSKGSGHTASQTNNEKGAPRSRSRSPGAARRARARARSPVDAEAAAREWLRQKNIAAEKFGVKPRSYKRPAPAPAAHPPEPPATILPVVTPAGNEPRVINDQVNKPAQSQINQKKNFHIVMRQGIPTVLPLTEENVAKHSAQSISRMTAAPTLLNNSNTTLTSTTQPNNTVPIILNQANAAPTLNSQTNVLQPTPPPLFNPNAVADINKKITNIVTLAPNTEPDAFGFRPLITNVHSLASTPKPPQKAVEKPLTAPCITLKKAEPVYASYLMNEELRMKSDPKVQQNYVIIPANHNQPVSRSILLQPSQEQTQNSVLSSAQTLPQVVNVAGGIHMSSTGAGHGLHLIVSQNQNPSLTSVVNNKTNQPVAVNANQRSNIAGSNQSGVVDINQQSNIVLNSQLGLMNTNQRSNIVVNNQPSMVVNQNLIQNVQNQQVSVRPGLQANPFLVTSVPQQVQSQPLLVSCPPLVTSMATSQPNVLFNSMPGRLAQGSPMLIRSVQAGPPSGTTAATTSRAGTAGASTVGTGTSTIPQPVRILPKPVPVPVPVESDKDNVVPVLVEDKDKGNANESSDRPMSPQLQWEAPAVRSHEWARARDSATLRVLCTGPPGAEGLLLADQFLVLSEEQPPPPAAAYWTLRPRRRLLMPDEEDKPASKCSIPDPPEPPTKTWLKVKDFARMPEDKTEDKPQKKGLSAPPRVFVDSLVYQKMSDEDLVYAKLLVAVSDARACRSLLARGAPLQLYCLCTGKLYPLQAEPKDDVSHITLSGDEEVSEALVALAQKLYRLPDVEPGTVFKESEATNDRTKTQDSANHVRKKRRALGGLDQEPEQGLDEPKRPRAQPPPPLQTTLSATKRAAKAQDQSQARPATVAVIELSDED